MEPISHTLTAPDGWSLDVLELGSRHAKTTVIAGHAMMVDRRTLLSARRPSLVNTLLDAGLHILLPNQRGRGASGPSPPEGDWSYDDLVEDTATYLDLAQRLAPRARIVLLGHSLFAHTALAWLGQHPEAPVDRVFALAMNIWNPRWNRSQPRALLKRLFVTSTTVLVRCMGYLPARRLGYGTADESRRYWESFARWYTSDVWDSASGVDYHAGLSRVSCPVVHVVSDGDRLYGQPDDALAFSAPLRYRDVWRLGSRCTRYYLRGVPAVDHMGMVTDPRSEALWSEIARALTTPLGT